MPGHALFVCHAGEGLGLGHLSRSLALAQAVQREAGWECTFLIQGSPVVRDGLDRFSHHFVPLASDMLAHVEPWLRDTAQATQRAIFLDLHPRHVPPALEPFLERLNAGAASDPGPSILRVAIDGLFDLHSTLDVLWVPSFRLSEVARKQLNTIANNKVLFGWDCLLVNSPLRTTPWSAGPRVLVLTGGADATNLGRHWPHHLDAELPASTELHWVKGPYAEPPALPSRSRLARVVEHVAPPSLTSLMPEVNYAVTVYGVTFYELLRAGVPTVVFSPYGNKDDAELQEIERLKLSLVARDEKHATDELNRLMSNSTLAQSLSAAGLAQMRGAYPHRLIERLRSEARSGCRDEVSV